MVALLLGLGGAAADEKPMRLFSEKKGWSNYSLSVSRDGKRLILNTSSIWEIPTGKKLLSVEPYCWHASAFSPDGSLFAVAGDLSLFYVRDAQTGKVIWDLTLVGHGNTVLTHLEFTADGRFLVSCSDNGMLRVWDLKHKKAEALFCFTSEKPVYNGWKEYVRAWRALAGDKPVDGVKAFVVFEKPIEKIYQFALSPDGKSVAVALGTSELLLLELATGKVLKTFRTEQVTNLSVSFSGDGKFLVVGGADEEEDTKKCTIEVWDVAAGKRLVTCPGHRHSILHLAISPDSKTIASGGMIDGVRVWDAATGKQKFALHQEGKIRVEGVAILPDGKTLLTLPGEDQPVCFWDLATGKPISPIQEKPPK